MAEFPSACFVPSDEEALERWNNDCTYEDYERILYYPVYKEEENLFWPVAHKMNAKFRLMIDAYEEEDVPYEYLEGCLELVNEVEALRDGNVAKALKKGIELKMPVTFVF